jgi:hypothetical protein
MNQALQSLSTLKEVLLEAAQLVRPPCSEPSRLLSQKIDELGRALDAGPVPSAEAEHEIMSVYVLSRLAGRRSHSTLEHP